MSALHFIVPIFTVVLFLFRNLMQFVTHQLSGGTVLGRFEVRKIVDMELSLIKSEPFSSRNVHNCKGVCMLAGV